MLTNLNKYGVYENKDEYNYSAQRGDNGYIEKRYTFNLSIFGSADESSRWHLTDEDAHALLISYLSSRFGDPAEYNGLPLSSMELRLVDDRRWAASLTFSNTENNADDYENQQPSDMPTVGMQNIQFNFTSQQVHRSHSDATVGYWYDSSMTGPIDYGGRINYVDGTTQGCDIIQPDMSFSITLNLSRESVDPSSFFPAVFAAVGHVNSDSWGIWAPGTVLFMGADIRSEKYSNTASDGQEIRYDYWQAVYTFKFNAGHYITTPDSTQLWCDGWDYAWAHSISGVDSSAIDQINVERVYPRMAFNSVFNWNWEIS